MRVAGFIDEVQNAHDRRSALYQSYDDAINKFKSSKDAAAFSAGRKKIDADYKQLTQQIQNIQAQLKTEGAEASEKVQSCLAKLFKLRAIKLFCVICTKRKYFCNKVLELLLDV